ncbi:hypothetical protein GCK72_025383 [Caenorhabditis remanei]|uniref:Uncharacterized protein n=1 Tax=Caenorhabditis remanei TaxID=31234 RepID=A0A6A5G1U9_CAERE|nr:hypothetical protein GCK72_025383 [Caenorhabditis remanei]KAF1748916.1 hypothetical protein GCK72_025383 [Caenorhabditis remanei]
MLARIKTGPWRGIVVIGCFVTYMMILCFTIMAPGLSPQDYFGVYQPVFGNIPDNVDLSYWDQCDLPNFDVYDDEIITMIDPNANPSWNCNKNFKQLTYLKGGAWGLVNKQPNVTCRASPPRPPKVETKNLTQYDVTVILLDSLSYTQARRSLPRTISYMSNHMDAVIFPFINKVGDNSRPNGMALWFGKLMEKLDRSIFEEKTVMGDWTNEYMCNVFKDNETSMFQEFQNYGYKTFLAEDWAKGTLNYPNCKGFDKPPIDHFMRPFQIALEGRNTALWVTKQHLSAKTMCREHHHTLLEYLGQFYDAYPDQKKFSWLWPSVLGHDTENGFSHSDNDFYNFLVQHRKQLENSFVLFMGDHGLRFGSFRKTSVGSLDVNNPFLAMSVPKALRNTTKLLDFMKANAMNLQTHFDTRATILDILKYQSASNFTDTEVHQIPGEKGNSFFRKQPDTPRSCKTLPIPLQYCICQFSKVNALTNSTVAISIGEKISADINEQITEGNFTEKCIKMEFGKVVSLLEYTEKNNESTIYTVEIEMRPPSNARYKTNVKILRTGEIKILGMIERSDRYGKTADCIKSEHHRPYCYCKNNIVQKRTTKKA